MKEPAMAKDFSTMENSNPSSNPSIHEVSDPARRIVVRGGLAGVATGLLAPLVAGCTTAGPSAPVFEPGPQLGFKSVPVSTADTVTVPPGYASAVICKWGDPVGLPGNMPAFSPAAANTAAEQAAQVGMHHDGMHYFPLDGSRRELVRRGDEIHYFFVDSKTVRVDRRVSGRSFPDFLPQDPSVLAAYYSLETGPVDRAAGRAVQVIRLRAKDGSRYTHEIWADLQSGLPVKRRVIDERGEVVEQFVFTELSVGERVSPRQALPGRRTGYAGWTVENASVEEVRASSVGATVPPPAKAGEQAAMAFPEPRALPPGFRKLTQVSRTLPGHECRMKRSSVRGSGCHCVRPYSRAKWAEKCSTNRGMSSARDRSGGTFRWIVLSL
jgi:hypothetical protein